jgi:hypothetical protein
MKITIKNVPFYHPKRRYFAWRADEKFDVSINLGDYEIVSSRITNHSDIEYSIKKIQNRYIPLKLKDCNIDFGNMEDEYQVRKLVSQSDLCHPTGMVNRGIVVEDYVHWDDKEKIAHNRLSPRVLHAKVVLGGTEITEIRKGAYSHYYGLNNIEAVATITKNVLVNGFLVGSFENRKIIRPDYPQKPPRPYLLKAPGSGLFGTLRAQFRASGYPRGVAKRKALEMVDQKRYQLLEDYKAKRAEYRVKIKEWKNECKLENSKIENLMS